MTKKAIRDRSDLLEELNRLKDVSRKQEESIKTDLNRLKDHYRPENILIRTLGSLTGIDINRNEFLKNGVAMGIGLVLQRFLFKQEAAFERKIYDWVDTVFERIRRFAEKVTHGGPVRSEKIEK
ncbi:MAG: hypothetical protein ACKO1U_10145 [Bacteroidota bacterium]